MKKHIKPCNCETCEQDRWIHKCPGCKEGHSSFWKTVIESPQWKLWQKEQNKRMASGKVVNGTWKGKNCYDMPEVEECGTIGQEHFQDFIKFIS